VGVGIPAVGLLGEADLVLAEWRAVGLLGVLLVRAAEPDMGPDRDERRPVVGAGGFDGRLDRGEIVAVRDAGGAPAIRVETLEHVLGPGHVRGAVQLDVVVVVQHDELAEAEVAGEARRLRGDALLEVTVGRDDIRPVIDDCVIRPVELAREAAFRDRHANGVRKALAERARRRLDAWRQPVLRMARRARAPLPELHQVLELEAVARQVEQGVQEHRGVAGR
jgi:hypothetical protein